MALPVIKRSTSGFTVTWPNGSITKTPCFATAKAAVEGYNEAKLMQAAEQAAEAAWLHAAEATTDADWAFEAWERDRGCAADPQSGY